MADENLDDIASLKQKIINLFEASLKVILPEGPNVVPLIAPYVKKEAGSRKKPAVWTKKEATLEIIDDMDRVPISKVWNVVPVSISKVKLSFLAESSYVLFSTNTKFTFGYSNNAMSLWARIRNTGKEFMGPESIAQAIVRNLPANDIIESCCVAGPGYVNVILSKQWMAQSIHTMLMLGFNIYVTKFLRVRSGFWI
ncbi:arginine--tRNA ligase, cytoplasmic-like protein isoform X1 [Tanacetum coccineum]